MIILDTDHITVLRYPEHSQHGILSGKMDSSVDVDFATTAISVEEQMRGWLAAIRRKHKVHAQILYYTRLIGLIRFWVIGEFCHLTNRRPIGSRSSAVSAFASVRTT